MDATMTPDFWNLADTIYERRSPAIDPAALEHARRAVSPGVTERSSL